MEKPILEVRNLESGYDKVQVLWGINLSVNHNEIVALAGSNGAGKTTLLRAISGLLTPTRGEVFLNGIPINGVKPEKRLALGLVHIPEGRQLFAGMTIKENLMMGAFWRNDPREVVRDFDWVVSLFPELKPKLNQPAGTLSGGQQQMCAIGRGLMAKPKILLIDELSLGLAPIIVDRLIDLLEKIHRESNLAILLVDQDVHAAFGLAQRGYVMETGHMVHHGDCQDLLTNADIKKAYLGI